MIKVEKEKERKKEKKRKKDLINIRTKLKNQK